MLEKIRKDKLKKAGVLDATLAAACMGGIIGGFIFFLGVFVCMYHRHPTKKETDGSNGSVVVGTDIGDHLNILIGKKCTRIKSELIRCHFNYTSSPQSKKRHLLASHTSCMPRILALLGLAG